MKIECIKQKLIDENAKEKEIYGEGFLLEPTSTSEIEVFIKEVYASFSIDVSTDYLELVKLSNGLSVNGLNIYGIYPYNGNYFIDGVLDINNEFWSEPTLRKYFSYGDESSTRLVFNIELSRYEAVDSVTWEMIEHFSSFSGLLSYVIEECHILD